MRHLCPETTHLTITQQRGLFRRWNADPAAHPHEALVGLLAMLHGASSTELRLLRVDHINASDRSIRLGKRPHPVPLDPVSWTALQRALDHRDTQPTDNPHVIVTRGGIAASALGSHTSLCGSVIAPANSRRRAYANVVPSAQLSDPLGETSVYRSIGA
jgi:integrase